MKDTGKRVCEKLLMYAAAVAAVVLMIGAGGIMKVSAAELNTAISITGDTPSRDMQDGWAWDAQTKTMTLDGLDLKTEKDIGIFFKRSVGDSITINVAGDSSIYAEVFAVLGEPKIIIKGKNNLKVESYGDGSTFYSNTCTYVDMAGGSLTITNNCNTEENNILSNAVHGDFYIKRGIVNINAYDEKNLNNKTFKDGVGLIGGNVTVEDGVLIVRADGYVTYSNGINLGKDVNYKVSDKIETDVSMINKEGIFKLYKTGVGNQVYCTYVNDNTLAKSLYIYGPNTSWDDDADNSTDDTIKPDDSSDNNSGNDSNNDADNDASNDTSSDNDYDDSDDSDSDDASDEQGNTVSNIDGSVIPAYATPVDQAAVHSYYAAYFTQALFGNVQSQVVDTCTIVAPAGADGTWKSIPRFIVRKPATAMLSTDKIYAIWSDAAGNTCVMPAIVMADGRVLTIVPSVGESCMVSLVKVQ